MLSFRLITTGLDDIHSVIGYVMDSEAVLIQPPEGARFSYEAMHDVNGFSIPELQEQGKDRVSTLMEMLNTLDEQTVMVYYLPFIKKFIQLAQDEVGHVINVDWVDVYEKAKQKKLPTNDLKLATLYEHCGVDNLPALDRRLDLFKNLPRGRRL